MASRKYHYLQAKAHRKAAEAWKAIDENKPEMFSEAHDFFADAHLYESDRYPDPHWGIRIMVIGILLIVTGVGFFFV